MCAKEPCIPVNEPVFSQKSPVFSQKEFLFFGEGAMYDRLELRSNEQSISGKEELSLSCHKACAIAVDTAVQDSNVSQQCVTPRTRLWHVTCDEWVVALSHGTYQCIMAHMNTPLTRLRHIAYKCVMSAHSRWASMRTQCEQRNMSRHVCTSHIYARVMEHIQMRHRTHMNASCLRSRDWPRCEQ